MTIVTVTTARAWLPDLPEAESDAARCTLPGDLDEHARVRHAEAVAAGWPADGWTRVLVRDHDTNRALAFDVRMKVEGVQEWRELRTCAQCGCTSDRACAVSPFHGCSWVAAALCSGCAGDAA